MNRDYCGLLLVAALLGGCGQKTSLPGIELPPTRMVATVYAVQASTGAIPCYREPDTGSPVVTQLRNQQLVDLVSLQDGMVQRGEEFWLHVYPRIGHRPACYLNIRHLVPVS